jgi:uncharacterized protein
MKEKLILGTVQFGLDYGINNSEGKPDIKSVKSILEYAISQKIHILDTADAYGNSSEIIGMFNRQTTDRFDIITKFKNIEKSTLSVEKWINESISKLNVNSLWGCMFHSADDYFNNSEILNEFVKFQQTGIIKYIGVSIYTNKQFEVVINDQRVNLIQLPYNLLDNIKIRGELIEKAKEKGKIIHVRSVFLQGLFFMNISKLPDKLLPLKPLLTKLHNLTEEYEISMESMALNYCMNNENIDGILIGIDSVEQLKLNVNSLSVKLPSDLIDALNNISTPFIELLNPTNWK